MNACAPTDRWASSSPLFSRAGVATPNRPGPRPRRRRGPPRCDSSTAHPRRPVRICRRPQRAACKASDRHISIQAGADSRESRSRRWAATAGRSRSATSPPAPGNRFVSATEMRATRILQAPRLRQRCALGGDRADAGLGDRARFGLHRCRRRSRHPLRPSPNAPSFADGYFGCQTSAAGK